MKYLVVMEQADDGSWSGLVPDAPGLLLMGDTQAELLANAPEAIRFHLEDQETHMPRFVSAEVEIAA